MITFSPVLQPLSVWVSLPFRFSSFSSWILWIHPHHHYHRIAWTYFSYRLFFLFFRRVLFSGARLFWRGLFADLRSFLRFWLLLCRLSFFCRVNCFLRQDLAFFGARMKISKKDRENLRNVHNLFIYIWYNTHYLSRGHRDKLSERTSRRAGASRRIASAREDT